MNLTAIPSPLARRRVVRLGRASGLALALALLPGLGCGREFFREWADQDVSEAVYEKSRDPRWNLPLFSIEPPSLSRFADPYDPDRPPAPPDDRAAEALSPVPQSPIFRLLTPQEGTGYNDMLEAGPRYEPEEAKKPEPGYSTTTPRPIPPRTGSPFERAPNSGPNLSPMTPNTVPADVPASPATPGAGAGSSPPQASANPRQDSGVRLAAQKTPDPKARPASAAGRADRAKTGPATSLSGSVGRPASPPTVTLRAPADPRVRPASAEVPSSRESAPAKVTLRAPADPRSRSAAPNNSGAAARTTPASSKRFDTDLRRAAMQVADAQPPQVPAAGAPEPQPRADSPVMQERPIPLDPRPDRGDQAEPTVPRGGLSPDQYERSGAATAGLAGMLAPGAATFDETEAAALPRDSRPYIIDPPTALNLALINNRSYQFNIEQIYVQALTVTLQRFAFQPQFFAGLSPSTGVAGAQGQGGSFPSNNFVNSFLYRTKAAPGGQSSVMSIGDAAGFGKAFSSGARLVAGFANQVTFNFSGRAARQPTVQSILPLTLVQPFLRGGGRAVTLEPLTLAERTLLYQIRSFARIRQEFVPYILTQNNPLDTTATGVFEPNVGYLNVVQQIQQVENDRKTVASFEQLLAGFKEMAKGGGSGVSQLNIDQINVSLLQARVALITDVTTLRTLYDTFKPQLGLPPDVPIIIDRGVLNGFRRVFDEVEVWFSREDRQPEELPGFVEKLPALEEIFLDGRTVVAMGSADKNHQQEDVIRAGERIALENRFDLMNARAQLYDAWRNLTVTANALMGVFTINITNQFLTPTSTTNPFGFLDQSKQFALQLNAELPLVRMVERNAFRTAQLTYRRQQRILQSQEDNIKVQVRTDIRNLILNALRYDIQKEQLVVNLRQKDNAQRQIFAPPGPGDTGASTQVTAQTQALVSAQSGILNAQNLLIGFWVTYQQFRLALYKDLGTIPYDEWEAYYELFPQATPKPPGGGPPAAAGARRAPAGAAADAPPVPRP